MFYRGPLGAFALMAALLLPALLVPDAPARAFDQSRYPDLKGQWLRVGSPRWDDDHAPLTAQYQAIYQANLKDMAAGGQGIDPTYTCISPGMPRIMNVYDPMEVVVTPATTHILIQHIHDVRRIFTDGRAFPTERGADLRGLFHRQMARYQGRRPLRPARGRDPQSQGPARLRRQRAAVPRGQRDGHPRAHLSRQDRPGPAARRHHRDGPCA